MNADLLSDIYSQKPEVVWQLIAEHLWQHFSAPVETSGDISAAILKRDRAIAPLDNLIAGTAWELWDHFVENTRATSRELQSFWENRSSGKAILILDGLSLREAPWILSQAEQRGFTIKRSEATASELPGNTTPFAKSLGFPQRSALGNDGAGSSHKLTGAWTECDDQPWLDCAKQIKAQSNIVYWHQWPDERMHHLSSGDGASQLAGEVHDSLCSDDFWVFIDRLATGRELVITSDHGYATTGLFPDVSKSDQTDYLKSRFKSGRACPAHKEGYGNYWLPPLTRILNTPHGETEFALGRKKWRSQGGYPTLTHGGLSLLEVFVPFIELSKA